MSTGAAPLEISEAIASVAVPLDLEEVLTSAPADVQERMRRLMEADAGAADTLKPLYVIRPGIGRGKGRHLYEADMLKRDAGVFKGWRMYVDHLSESARKALNGLPRSIRDLGGRLVESWWDPDVPEDSAKGFGKGAVVGISRPVPYVKELIEHDPDLIEASIAARATGVSPRRVGSEQVWVVEGFEPKGSVDWVTEGGAGGKVVSLIEALYEGDDRDAQLFDSMSDEDVAQYLRTSRPELAAELLEGNGNGDGSQDEVLEAKVTELMGKGLSREMAMRAAKRSLGEAGKPNEGDDDVPVTIDDLREAFATDDGKALLEELVGPLVEERAGELLKERLPEAIEEALDEERELLMLESRADVERANQLRDMRDEAHRMIAESRLPERFQQEAKEKFVLSEGVPTPALDILDELDDQGNVVKAAEELLAEAVTAEIERQRELLAAANPTRVRTPVARKKSGDGDDDGEEKTPKSTGSAKTDALLEEAGIDRESFETIYG